MRKSDCVWLAAKLAFGTKNTLFLIGLAAAVYCVCVGGGLVSGVQEQRSMPYELNATAGSSAITNQIVAKAGQVEGVLASSAQLDVPATFSLGGNTAGIHLDGIEPDYMQGIFTSGTVFPKDSAMPYIVLNQAAFDQLQDKNTDGNVDDTEKINWQKAACLVLLGDNVTAAPGKNKSTAAKICGILEDDTKDPKAYISLSNAKKLAGGEYTACLVRVRNVDSVKDVSDKIFALGLSVQNIEPTQESDWDRKNTEATYLLLLGIALLFYSVYLYIKAENLKEGMGRKELELLMYIGLSSCGMQRLYSIKNLFYCCIALGFGVLFYALIPWFLPPDIRQVVNIAYPFSAGGVLSGAALCAASFLICFGTQKGVIKRIAYY